MGRIEVCDGIVAKSRIELARMRRRLSPTAMSMTIGSAARMSLEEGSGRVSVGFICPITGSMTDRGRSGTDQQPIRKVWPGAFERLLIFPVRVEFRCRWRIGHDREMQYCVATKGRLESSERTSMYDWA